MIMATENIVKSNCPVWHPFPEHKDVHNLPNSDPIDPDTIMTEKNDGKPPTIIKTTSVMMTGSSCPVCGGDMVFIRGKHPNSPKRIVCPTCLADKIDTIREISNPNDGYGKQEKK